MGGMIFRWAIAEEIEKIESNEKEVYGNGVDRSVGL